MLQLYQRFNDHYGSAPAIFYRCPWEDGISMLNLAM
jgi:hypothetical protein